MFGILQGLFQSGELVGKIKNLLIGFVQFGEALGNIGDDPHTLAELRLNGLVKIFLRFVHGAVGLGHFLVHEPVHFLDLILEHEKQILLSFFGYGRFSQATIQKRKGDEEPERGKG